jgi:hypothetical protein
MDDPEATTNGPRADACPSCGNHPRWESVLDRDDERWFSVCRCGRMQAFLPDAPETRPADPLAFFLAGPGRALAPPNPPWVRAFLQSLEAPRATRWWYRPGRCAGCGAAGDVRDARVPAPLRPRHKHAVPVMRLGYGRLLPARPRHGGVSGDRRSVDSAVSRGSAPTRDSIFRPYAVLIEGDDGNPTEWVPAA